MPSMSKGSMSSSGIPAQPIHAPSLACMTGASAVTRPPGEVVQTGSGPESSRSTGRRLATTTKSAPSGGGGRGEVRVSWSGGVRVTVLLRVAVLLGSNLGHVRFYSLA